MMPSTSWMLLVACLSSVLPGVSCSCRTSESQDTDPIVPPPSGGGQTYYVSPTGSNANAGTQESPWASPGHASRRLGTGDTLIILGGTYVLSEYDDDIVIPPSGTQSAWTTLRGETGKRPVLAGRNNLSHAVDLSGKSYVQMENIEITHDATATGNAAHFREAIVIADSPATHIVLKDLYIHHIDEFGLNFQDAEHVTITDCRFEYCGFGAIGGPNGLQGGLRSMTITRCRLSYGGHYYQGTDGTHRPYDRPDGFGIEPSQGPITIEGTIAEHNYGDGLDSKAANTTFRNCIVANNSCDGIKLWGDNSKVINCLVYGTGDGVGGASPWAGIVIGTEQAGSRFEIVNTTVHDNPTRQAYPMYVQYDSNAAVTVTLRNTIIAGGYGVVFFGSGVSLTAEHNLFHRGGSEPEQVELAGTEYTSTAIEGGALGPGNRCGDPRFVNPAWGQDGDYHLQDGSPAIDQGTSTGAPATDLDGDARPQGAGIDIGAYER